MLVEASNPVVRNDAHKWRHLRRYTLKAISEGVCERMRNDEKDNFNTYDLIEVKLQLVHIQ